MESKFQLLARRTSKSLKISPKELTVEGAAGYRSTVCNIKVKKKLKEFYFEVQIENGEGFVRVGIATDECEINGPVGMDAHGYSYGSKNGYGFHNSVRKTMGERAGKGDILSVSLEKHNKTRILHFYINGVKCPKSFKIRNDNAYYPAVSPYGKCKVKLNFGPYFAYYDKIKRNKS